MREWLAAQLAAGLPALAGSRVSGTLVVAPALVNELLAAWLAGTGPASASSPRLEIDTLRAAVKSLSVRAEQDRLLIDVEIGL